VLAVKGNQPTLHQAIEKFFDDHLQDDFARTKVRRHQTEEKGHGGREPLLLSLPCSGRSARSLSLGQPGGDRDRSEQHATRREGLLRSPLLHPQPISLGRRFAEAVRDHWGIENQLHWQLDVTFQEDQCRIAKDTQTETSVPCAARR